MVTIRHMGCCWVHCNCELELHAVKGESVPPRKQLCLLKFVNLIVKSSLFKYKCFNYYHVYFVESEVHVFWKNSEGKSLSLSLHFHSTCCLLLLPTQLSKYWRSYHLDKNRTISWKEKLFKMSENPRGKIRKGNFKKNLQNYYQQQKHQNFKSVI